MAIFSISSILRWIMFEQIVEQEVKGNASSSSSSSSQNMAFVSSPSSTNEVNTAYGVSTANTQVSPASTQDSTASTQVSTANLSDDTVYAFLASQPNGSQLVYEDLEQIHEDDIEEMDLKCDTAGYDKSKVECINCHKMGNFSRECRGPRNQDSRNMNQDSSRRTVNVEETSSKAMVAIDGAGFDWSYMADEEVPTNMALMAFSDSKPEFDGYRPKTSKSVSEYISNKVRESPDALLVKELVSNAKLEKKTADCNYHQRERMVSGNNYTRVNYNYSAKKAHPSAHRNMILKAVLMKTGLRSLNTARPVQNTNDLEFGVQTRRMTKTINEQGFISAVYEGKTNEDLHTCLFACFLSQEEPKKDSPFDLEAYTDSDYAGACFHRKSTTELMLPGITYYFWATAKAKSVNEEVQIQALVDGKKEDAFKQWMKIADLDADAEVTLVDEAQGKNDDYLMFDIGVLV
ncbi:ribonuclease H-like domain-containing protein [Tanacetum coccineum]